MKALNYSDIYLVPKYSELITRSDADISVEFCGERFKASWLPANMKSSINEIWAKWLSENDYFYIYHRFGDILKFIKDAQEWKLISISVGVKEDDKKLIKKISSEKDDENFTYLVDFITIDVAMGHHKLVKDMISFIRSSYNEAGRICPKIIAGNICTPDAALDLQDWGADAVKVGIANGAVCSTKNATGFMVPMFTAIKNCSDAGIHIPIIGDGGIRENGDIAKSLVAGSALQMVGKMIVECCDSPAEIIYINNVPYKRYFGSASYSNKNYNRHIEGFETDIICSNLTLSQKYQEMKESLQSSISYAGGKDLRAFNSVQYVEV